MTPSDPTRVASLAVMADPARWPANPFLPLVRPRAGGGPDLGVMFDALGFVGWTGFAATVFVGNLVDVLDSPDRLVGLLALPREAFASLSDLVDAGWRVD